MWFLFKFQAESGKVKVRNISIPYVRIFTLEIATLIKHYQVFVRRISLKGLRRISLLDNGECSKELFGLVSSSRFYHRCSRRLALVAQSSYSRRHTLCYYGTESHAGHVTSGHLQIPKRARTAPVLFIR